MISSTSMLLGFGLFGLGFWEVAIVVVLALLLFSRKLPDLGRAIGKSFSDLKKGVRDVTDEQETDGGSPQAERLPEPPRPPEPADPFLAALQAAWSSEAGPDKARHRDLLASLYRVAARDTVGQPLLQTIGDLFDGFDF